MNGANPGRTHSGWRRELERTSECIPIERLSEELTAREHSHLAHCARCQAELALWKKMDEDVHTLAESDAIEAVVAEIRKRMAGSPSNVVPLPRGGKIVRFHPAALAAAAALVLTVGIGLIMQNREPSVEGPVSGVTAYRSSSVDVISPRGDVVTAPVAFLWKPVPGALSYDVQVMEVDHDVLWSASVSEPRIDLPPALVVQFVPGKAVLWQIAARRGKVIIANSGIQRFRVSAMR